MAENSSNNYLTSFAEHLHEQYGERGTPAREEFEAGFEDFKFSIMQQETLLQLQVQ